MNINRIKVLGLLSLPLLAIAVAVMVFAIGHSSDTAEAATEGGAMSLRVDAGQQIQCGSPAAGKVCIGNGSKFDVIVVADAAPVTKGYVFAGAWLDYGATGLVHKNATVSLWPDCNASTFLATEDVPNNAAAVGCLTGIIPPLPVSTHKGDLFSFSLTCDTENSHEIALIPAGTPPANTNGALYKDDNNLSVVPSVTGLNVNCTVPPTDTPTNTPTNTPTETPTNTPPPIPRMSKLPLLQNVFLTRQDTKIPPDSCLAGADIGTLTEGLSAPIVSPDPKNPTAFQALAAYEFEVHYDNKKVCVQLTNGAEFAAAGAICIIEDSATKPALEGVARIGCVTIGKGHGLVGAALTTIEVRAQPDLYSEIKPNQDNGNVVQLNNVNCDVGDEQGHAIPIFSCDDADITFRYLEGDVEPDCVIDAIDAQAIAFRWGVEKGSLIYKDFMNLEPSSQQQDNDIDINDLQFVFGRFGSTCEAPHPPQDPVNPKA